MDIEETELLLPIGEIELSIEELEDLLKLGICVVDEEEAENERKQRK